MGVIFFCHLVFISSCWSLAMFPWWEDHLNRQTNKQTNIGVVKYDKAQIWFCLGVDFTLVYIQDTWP